jgi:hypothetical protein
VRTGERLPPLADLVGGRAPERAFLIVVDSVTMLAVGKDAREGRFYWCRYENAHGQTWDTRNPVDPAGKMTIHRVRFAALRESREEGHLKRLHRHGLAKDAQLGAELLAATEAARSAEEEPPEQEPPARAER